MCTLTPNLVGPRTPPGYVARMERILCGSIKDELKVDLSGGILVSGTDLPLKWSRDSGQQLYAISKRGGLQRTNRAVATYGLPLINRGI